MTDEDWASDDYRELMELVAQTFDQGDPVPESVVARGRSYVRWMAPDADIGVIVEEALEVSVRDTDVDSDEYVFTTDRHRIELTAGEAEIVGSIQPWVGGEAWLEHDSGPAEIDVNEHGEFYVASPPRGALRIHVRTATDEVVTAWFQVNRNRNS